MKSVMVGSRRYSKSSSSISESSTESFDGSSKNRGATTTTTSTNSINTFDVNRESPTSILEFNPHSTISKNDAVVGLECSSNDNDHCSPNDTNFEEGSDNNKKTCSASRKNHGCVITTTTTNKELKHMLLEHPLVTIARNETVVFQRSCTPRAYFDDDDDDTDDNDNDDDDKYIDEIKTLNFTNNNDDLQSIFASTSARIDNTDVDKDDVSIRIIPDVVNDTLTCENSTQLPINSTLPCCRYTTTPALFGTVAPIRTQIRFMSSSNYNANDQKVVTPMEKISILPMPSRRTRPRVKSNVTFNEAVEIRYFSRSEDELMIMHQCSMERRKQQQQQQHMSSHRLRQRQIRRRHRFASRGGTTRSNDLYVVQHSFCSSPKFSHTDVACSSYNHVQDIFRSMFLSNEKTSRNEKLSLHDASGKENIEGENSKIYSCGTGIGSYDIMKCNDSKGVNKNKRNENCTQTQTAVIATHRKENNFFNKNYCWECLVPEQHPINGAPKTFI